MTSDISLFASFAWRLNHKIPFSISKLHNKTVNNNALIASAINKFFVASFESKSFVAYMLSPIDATVTSKNINIHANNLVITSTPSLHGRILQAKQQTIQ